MLPTLSTRSIPEEKTEYPYGLCVQTEAGVFLIRQKGRFRIPTERILDSWRLTILPSTEAAVKHLPITGKIGFRDGTLIKNVANGKMYLISQNKRRHITSPDVFDRFGFLETDILDVSDEEADLHSDGEVLK